MFAAPDTDTDPTVGGGFKAPDDDLDPKSISGFGKNLVEDVKGNVKGLADLAQGLGEHPIDTIKNVPGALVNEGKRIGLGELLTGHPINAVEKFGNAAYDKPLSTAMDVAPVVGAAGKALGLGGVAAEGADAASAAAKAAEVAGETEKAAPAAETAAGAAKTAETSLPVMQPGLKTGDPHALFAYNDKFGPGGTERSLYNVFGDPEHPAVKQVGFGSSVPKEDLDKAGIPVVGREPRSTKWEPIETKTAAGTPEPWVYDLFGTKDQPSVARSAESAVRQPNFGPIGTPKEVVTDPLQEVKDYINSKYQTVSGKPGIAQKLAKMLESESSKLGAKDLGLQGRQVESMGPGFLGNEKAAQLVSYAREKGYFDPTLTDVSRKQLIQKNMDLAGKQLNAIRSLADQRGAAPLEAVKAAVKQELEASYGFGPEKAPAEIAKVMEKIDHAKPTFSSLSELATDLNKSATPVKKLGQHPGPTTDAANIVSRLNNDAIKGTLNPQERDLYTQSLRDYGAHKKLEQAAASGERRSMVARSNQRGILGRLYQEALDRGGYRLGGNIANKTAQAIMKNPKMQTLPQFFEELAHQANEAVDETIGGMYKGGPVPDDVRKYVGC